MFVVLIEILFYNIRIIILVSKILSIKIHIFQKKYLPFNNDLYFKYK